MTARSFVTLDGLRGVAALCIVLLHAHRYFMDPLPSAQMAVDLFFVLSGFVLAHAYVRRFQAGMSPLRFVLLRYIRLYPVYLLGILLGIVEAVVTIQNPQGSIEWDWSKFVSTLPFGLTMLPTPFASTLFPLNGIMWTIFLELVVNVIWAVCWRPLQSTKALIAVIVAAGLAFIVTAMGRDSTALGAGWDTFLGGLARVSYSFMFGALLYRVHDSIRMPRISPLLLVAVLPIAAALPLDTVAQLLCALAVFPLVVLLGAKVEPRGAVQYAFSTLGVASYALYALHNRLYRLSYGALLQFFGFRAEEYVPWVGILFVAVLVPACVLVATLFEPPARRFMTRMLDRQQGKSPDLAHVS